VGEDVRARYTTAAISAIFLITVIAWWLTRAPVSIEPTPAADAAPTTKAAPKLIKPSQSWTGNLQDTKLARLTPLGHMVSGPEAWATLWRSWRGDEPIPTIDFTTNLVFAFTCSGPNGVSPELWMDSDGRVRVEQWRTLMDGPGFGYTIPLVPRAGITSVDGRPVPP
jgi:hypothetical protein